MKESGHFDELHGFLQSLQKGNSGLQGAGTAEKAAYAKILLEVITLRGEKAAQKKWTR